MKSLWFFTSEFSAETHKKSFIIQCEQNFTKHHPGCLSWLTLFRRYVYYGSKIIIPKCRLFSPLVCQFRVNMTLFRKKLTQCSSEHVECSFEKPEESLQSKSEICYELTYFFQIISPKNVSLDTENAILRALQKSFGLKTNNILLESPKN